MGRNGAEFALEAARAAGVEVCFANPGTTEMDLVVALDKVPEIRSVLCLFEGVATGAADGYGRIAGKPALTLLHLGPGFANGIANLHNARRAGSPVLNLIGDHATWHLAADAPLTSDIKSLAASVSQFVRRSATPVEFARDLVDGVAAATGSPSGVASLIVAQEAAWEDAEGELPDLEMAAAVAAEPAAVAEAASRLRGKGAQAGLLLGGMLDGEALEAAARIRASTGCQVWLDTFVPRLREGRGIPHFDAVPYFPEQAMETLAGVESLVFVGTRSPVAFFGYRSVGRSSLLPEGCETLGLSGPGQRPGPDLLALAEALETGPAPGVADAPLGPVAEGAIDVVSLGLILAHWLPEEAILVNEAATSGLGWGLYGRSAAPHDVLSLTGGAIGQGIPNALGAAVAAPDRRVVALQADGSGLYTLQGLWTMAREELDVTVIVCANRAYRILQAELGRTGPAEPGPVAQAMTDLSRPVIEWTRLAEGMGVASCQVSQNRELQAALEARRAERGPYLIEVLL
ncbi:MAG: acetolactate synthase large subunit [Myxococcota bacterium]|nr:acetolactate synthase large subunit [Myxococcota bacterium]